MNNGILKRDSAVEFSRIIGCLIVIGVHTILSPVIGETYDPSRIFLSCLLADGVAVFWLIAGFFCFNSSYKKMLARTARNIGIPMLFFTILAFYFTEWLFYDASFFESISHSKEEYINIFNTLITWNNGFPYCSHLWYLYTYLLMAVAFPILKSFVSYLDKDPKKRWQVFIIISFTALIINDISSNRFCGFSLQSAGSIFPACLEAVYGYCLYKNRKHFFRRRYLLIAPLSFILLNLVRGFIQYNRYQIDPSNNWILFWFSSFGVACSVCILIFCFSLDSCINSITLKKHTCYAASCTLYIYLIHTHIISLVVKHGIPDHLQQSLLTVGLCGFPFDMSYTCLIVAIVFVISLLCSVIIKLFVSIAHISTSKIKKSCSC